MCSDPCIQNQFQAVWNMSKSLNDSMWMFPTLHCNVTNKRRHSALWIYESQIVQKTLNYKIGRYVFMIQTYYCSPLNLFRKLLSLLKGVFTKPLLIKSKTPNFHLFIFFCLVNCAKFKPDLIIWDFMSVNL